MTWMLDRTFGLAVAGSLITLLAAHELARAAWPGSTSALLRVARLVAVPLLVLFVVVLVLRFDRLSA